MGPCQSDTIPEEDGTVTAFCGCGWSENHVNQQVADDAARAHQETADQREAAQV